MKAADARVWCRDCGHAELTGNFACHACGSTALAEGPKALAHVLRLLLSRLTDESVLISESEQWVLFDSAERLDTMTPLLAHELAADETKGSDEHG